MENGKPADFYDVYAGPEGERYRVFRFEGTEQGLLRAKEYARKYSASLRDAMELTEADLGLKVERADLNNPEWYEKVQRVESYWEHSASVRAAYKIPVVKGSDPLPTDYPHGF